MERTRIIEPKTRLELIEHKLVKLPRYTVTNSMIFMHEVKEAPRYFSEN